MGNIHNGAIVLMHVAAPRTAEALPGIITRLRKDGYQLVTVSTLLGMWGSDPSGRPRDRRLPGYLGRRDPPPEAALAANPQDERASTAAMMVGGNPSWQLSP